MTDILKGSAVIPLEFLMVLSSDHITPATGLAPTVLIGKNGGVFAPPAGAVSEISNGWYKVAPNATDSNTYGPIKLHASAATADPTDRDPWQVVAYDPNDPNALGIGVLNSFFLSTGLGVVSTAVNAGDATHFRSATAGLVSANVNQFVGKQIEVLSGTFAGQWWGVVSAYSTISGEGAFTVGPGNPNLAGAALANGVIVWVH